MAHSKPDIVTGMITYDTICMVCGDKGRWTGLILDVGMWGYYNHHLPRACSHHPSEELRAISKKVKADGWNTNKHFRDMGV